MTTAPKQDSLSKRIQCKEELTDDEIDQLVKLIGGGCRDHKKARIKWALKACPNMADYGIYGRVLIKEAGGVQYCAGQSYPDEIRTVRECLVGR